MTRCKLTALLTLGFVLLGAAGCSASVQPPATAQVPAAPGSVSKRIELDTLQFIAAGIASPFVNGGEAPVGGDLVANVVFSPSDEGRFSLSLVVCLHRAGAPAQTVEGATIRAT